MSLRVRVPVVLVATLFLIPILAAPGLALAPWQNDADSGGDAGDTPSTATPITAGVHQGRIELPHDQRDLYQIQVTAGDAIHLDLEADGSTSITLSLRYPLRPPTATDDGLTTYGFIEDGDAFTVFAPYTGTWYIEVAGPPVWGLGLVGWSDYTFSYQHEADVATVHVIDAPAGVLEVEGFDGKFQYHIDSVLASGEPGVVRSRADTATLRGDDWSQWTFSSEIIRTAWGETLLGTTLPSPQDVVDEVVDLGGLRVSVLGTWKSEPDVIQRVVLMSSGDPVRITFAYPHGTVAEAAGSDEIVFRSVEDLSGSRLQTPVFHEASGASMDLPLGPTFGGTFYDWDQEITLRDPDGTDHHRMPERPVAGDWTVEAESFRSFAPDADMPLVWGAFYPDLGIWPETEPSGGFFLNLILRTLSPT